MEYIDETVIETESATVTHKSLKWGQGLQMSMYCLLGVCLLGLIDDIARIFYWVHEVYPMIVESAVFLPIILALIINAMKSEDGLWDDYTDIYQKWTLAGGGMAKTLKLYVTLNVFNRGNVAVFGFLQTNVKAPLSALEWLPAGLKEVVVQEKRVDALGCVVLIFLSITGCMMLKDALEDGGVSGAKARRRRDALESSKEE